MGYPTTVFSAPTRSAGQTIQASIVNDLQTEVAAIETQLLAGATSFAPTVSGTGGASGQVYSLQYGRAKKVGTLVFFTIRVALTTRGTITGQVVIDNLPYAAHASDGIGGVHVAFFGSLGVAMCSVSGVISGGGTSIALYGCAAAATSMSALAQADLLNTTDIILSGHYLAAS